MIKDFENVPSFEADSGHVALETDTDLVLAFQGFDVIGQQQIVVDLVA